MNKSDSKSSLEVQIKSMLNNVMDEDLKEDENEDNFKFSDEEDTQDNNSSNTNFNQMRVNNNIDFNINFFHNNKNLNNSDNNGNTNFVRKYPRKCLTLSNQNSQSNNLEKLNFFQTQILHKPFSFNGKYFPKNPQFMFPNYFNSHIDNQNNISFNSTEILNNNNNDLRTVNRKKNI